ncbi:MAG: hypothetical protein GY737_02150 [Desulfobacteraceae bacterium]|nr:hypothetical protein [Desulfobacteraceae bacterium]
MKKTFEKLRDRLVSLWRTADEVARGKAVDSIEAELEELEHVFALMVQGAFVGIPSPPMQISLELLPLMERELLLMTEKIDTANEPLSHLFSTFDVS